MDKIVTLFNGIPTTTTLVIAEGSRVQHKNVMELVRTYQADLEEFGPLAFETRKGAPLPQGGFAKATAIAILNEPQTTLLFTYMKNTAIVRQFKKRLVKEFYEMARTLAMDVFGAKPDDPFDRVCPHTLDSLRRINRSLAQAYLVKRGITPEFVAGVLGNPEAAGFSSRENADRAPLEVLRTKVPEYASAQDDNCWYLFQRDWEIVCQGYSAKWTARYLADLGLLRHDEGKLTMKAGPNLFGSRGGKRQRPYVYAVRKALGDSGNLPVVQ